MTLNHITDFNETKLLNDLAYSLRSLFHFGYIFEDDAIVHRFPYNQYLSVGRSLYYLPSHIDMIPFEHRQNVVNLIRDEVDPFIEWNT